MKQLHVRVTEELYKKLKQVTKSEWFPNVSECTRAAIRIGLRELEKKE